MASITSVAGQLTTKNLIKLIQDLTAQQEILELPKYQQRNLKRIQELQTELFSRIDY